MGSSCIFPISAASTPHFGRDIFYCNSLRNSKPPKNLADVVNEIGNKQQPQLRFNPNIVVLPVPEQQSNECGMPLAINEFARRLCNNNNDKLFDDWHINSTFLRLSQAKALWEAMQDPNFIQAMTPF